MARTSNGRGVDRGRLAIHAQLMLVLVVLFWVSSVTVVFTRLPCLGLVSLPRGFQALGKEKKGNLAGVESKKKDATFQWTDDEVRLLLEVTRDYKSGKEAEGIDWESIRSKYDDLTTLLREKLPEEGRPKGLGVLELPHGKGELTVKVLMSKLKAIRLKYRQAVDNGRRSGYGRVVLIFLNFARRFGAVIPPQTEFPAA